MTEHTYITIIGSNTQLLSRNFLCLPVLKFLFSRLYVSFGSPSIVWRTSSSSFPRKDIWLVKVLKVCLCVLSHVQLFATPWTVAWLLCLWNFPVKNTGGGCHFISRGCFWPRNRTHIWVSCIGRWIFFFFFTTEPPWKLGISENNYIPPSHWLIVRLEI